MCKDNPNEHFNEDARRRIEKNFLRDGHRPLLGTHFEREVKTEKFYLAVCFEGLTPKEAHVTVAYFGSLTTNNLCTVVAIIQNYACNSADLISKKPLIEFSDKQYFGEDEDIEVLIPTKINGVKLKNINKYLHNELRERLIEYDVNNLMYIDYKPHLTTKFPKVEVKVDCLSLISNTNGKILSWQ